MRLLKSHRGALVASSVIVLKSVILSSPSTGLVAKLAKSLGGISNPSARASVFWLVGQFASDDKVGLGWDGVASWVPDVFRQAVKGFPNEVGAIPTAKLGISCKTPNPSIGRQDHGAIS